MADLIKVVDGGNFRNRWEGLCITLKDFENIKCDNYELELYNLFEYHSFQFDDELHEYWEIE